MQSSAPGYWASHEYKRHSVGEIEEFVGWGRLAEICRAGTSPRDRAFPAALFETGCRVSEGIRLTTSHFDLSDPQWVRCVDVPIVKQKKVAPSRTFSFLRSEPLFSVIEPYLSGLKPGSQLFPFTRQRAYQIVKAMGKKAGIEVWDHWFRSQRASQMGAEYRLSESQLMEWFKVRDPTWARRYCKLGDFGLRGIISERKPTEWRA
jgi:integrase